MSERMLDPNRIKPKYAGKKSKAFWRRIRRIKDDDLHRTAYGAGVELQDLEYRTLALIRNLEIADKASPTDPAVSHPEPGAMRREG